MIANLGDLFMGVLAMSVWLWLCWLLVCGVARWGKPPHGSEAVCLCGHPHWKHADNGGGCRARGCDCPFFFEDQNDKHL